MILKFNWTQTEKMTLMLQRPLSKTQTISIICVIQ